VTAIKYVFVVSKWITVVVCYFVVLSVAVLVVGANMVVWVGRMSVLVAYVRVIRKRVVRVGVHILHVIHDWKRRVVPHRQGCASGLLLSVSTETPRNALNSRVRAIAV
jgi:hypothetical protein